MNHNDYSKVVRELTKSVKKQKEISCQLEKRIRNVERYVNEQERKRIRAKKQIDKYEKLFRVNRQK